MPNPYAQYTKPNPYAVYKTAPQPKTPTPPSGYAPAGNAPALTYQPGGPNDPAVAARLAATEAAARAGASAPIETRYQIEAARARAAIDLANEKAKNQLPTNRGQTFDNVAQMRKELEGRNSVQVYKNALPSYAAALRSPDTPAGDQDMIYAFAKIMDPNSVVREGEANSVAALGTMGQQIAGNLRKQLDGSGKFTPELRTQLRNTLAGRISEYNKAYTTERQFFRSIADRNGLPADDIVGPHLGDAYAKIENQYFRGDPNKSAAAARAEAAAPKFLGGGGPGAPATGPTINVNDPQAGAAIDALVRNGGSLDQVNAVIKSLGPNQTPITPEQFATAQGLVAKGYKGPLSSVQKEEGNPFFRRAASSPVGVGIGAAVDAGMAGLSDEATAGMQWAGGKGNYADLLKTADGKKQAAFNADPKSALIGNVVGASGAMLTGGVLADAARVPGLTRMFAGRAAQKALPVVGDMAYGAAYGAGNSNDNRALGAGVGAASGLIGNVVGKKVAKVAGGTLRGVKNAAVDYLDAAGVPMTGGQILGGTTKAIEDKLTSIPFVGDIIKNRRNEGYQAYNQAAFQQAGQPIGASITDVGDAGLRQLNAAKSKAYGAALDPASINMHDPSVVSDLAGVSAQARAIPNVGNASDAAMTALDHRIVGGTDASGMMPGRNFQEAYRGLSRTARERANGDYGYEVGQSMEAGKDALATALEAQNPGAYQGFLNANRSNRNLNILASATDAAKNQVNDAGRAIFTPAQLNTAASGNTRMFAGKIASASNDKPFADLTKYGQQVLPSKVPDSGTAGRAAIGLLAATAGGGAAGGVGGMGVGEADKGGGIGAGAGLIAGLLNTKAGQKALTAMLLRRPQVAEDAGNWLIKQSPLGGHLGASFASPFASERVTPWLAR